MFFSAPKDPWFSDIIIEMINVRKQHLYEYKQTKSVRQVAIYVSTRTGILLSMYVFLPVVRTYAYWHGANTCSKI